MTFFSNSDEKRGLDAMIIIYSLLDDHPASSDCEKFIRNRTGWFTYDLQLISFDKDFDKTDLERKEPNEIVL